jgi:hypothetical protein
MGSAYPTGAIVVPLGPNEPQPSPSRRTDLGCKMVADGHFGSPAEGSQGTISLQIDGGLQRFRTADLRRASAGTSVLVETGKCH